MEFQMKAWHPYSKLSLDYKNIQIQTAKNEYLYTPEQDAYFDGISSWWLITHGHSHQYIIEAVAKQSLQFSQTVFADFTHENAEKLILQMGKLLPNNFDRCFFSDNGSTSVEIAMKMAIQYFQLINRPKKNKFISFTHSYHGDTCGAMSASSNGLFSRRFKDMKFEVFHAKQGTSINDPLEFWTKNSLEIIEKHKSEICAIILEPMIQGAGGMIVWPIEAINIICEFARMSDILIIFDEVMTGFGRSGSMFAFEQTNSVPDFICLSKGLTGGFLPLGLTIVDEKISEIYTLHSLNQPFFHGHSFTANALSCAAAVANIELFHSENTLSKIKIIENVHRSCLQHLNDKPNIKETRVCGSIGVVELNSNHGYQSQFSDTLKNHCFKNGLYIRPLGNIIYIMPPYCSSRSTIENAWKIIEEGLDN